MKKYEYTGLTIKEFISELLTPNNSTDKKYYIYIMDGDNILFDKITKVDIFNKQIYSDNGYGMKIEDSYLDSDETWIFYDI